RHEGAEPGVPPDVAKLINGRIRRKLQCRKLPSLGTRSLDELTDSFDFARAGDEVDPGCPLEDLVPADLSQAARYPDDDPRVVPFSFGEAAQRAIDLRLGLLADRAGVEQENVRLVGGARLP